MKRFPIIFAVILLACSCATAALGATITAQPGDNLQADLNNAAGRTLILAAGTFTINSPITIPSGVTITGAPGLASHVVYTGASPSAAFIVAANASNVTVQGIDLVSSNGLFKMMDGSGYSNITITRCNLGYTSGGNFGSQQIMGITDTLPANGLQVTHNYFHDDAGSGRNWYVFGCSNSNFDYNLFRNINDGGQIVAPGAAVSISCNYGTALRRMGQETASNDGAALTVNGNVFYGWASVTTSSFGLSICTTPAYTGSVGDSLTMTGNYVALPATGLAGNCYEFGAKHCNFSNNISAAGTGVTPNGQLVTMMAGATGSSNRSYGPNGATVLGEPGPIGGGSWIGAAPINDPNYADAPAPPANTFAGPNPMAASPVPTPAGVTTAPALTLNAAATSNAVTISWVPQLTNAAVTFSTPSESGNTVIVPGTTGGAMFGGANAGWLYDYSVSAGTLSGSGTFLTSGSSPNGTIIQPLALLTDPVTQPTPPPPATQPTVTHTITIYSDGSFTSQP